ncbi:MAG: hypothetical protein QNJ38_16760 [Prochloraceae cyanobacterium]|nr:hypothetical protein [Prochloraceae cyanobacterium]
MIPQKNSKSHSEPGNLSKVSGHLKDPKTNQQPKLPDFPILVQLNKRHQKFLVEYQGQKIGTIKPLIDGWQANAYAQFGFFENQLDSREAAVHWLLENYFAVKNAGIKFSVSENCGDYTIEKDYYLVKIDVTPEDCIASIVDGNQFDLAYFPDPQSAIHYAFDFLLDPKPRSIASELTEFIEF